MMRPDPEQSDEALAERARQGDEEAFQQLFERHAPELRRSIRRRLQGLLRRKLGESDVIQMTYFSVHRSLGRFENRGDGSFKAWLDAIVEHRLAEVLRHYVGTAKRSLDHEVSGPQPLSSGGIPEPAATPSIVAMSNELTALIEEAMAQLPEDYRRLLQLVQGEGLTLAEAGARMGRSAGAARQLYARALGRLRKIVHEEETG
jgi:RNA polymerase sigma-70 factor (ECF subfamily)